MHFAANTSFVGNKYVFVSFRNVWSQFKRKPYKMSGRKKKSWRISYKLRRISRCAKICINE